MEINKKVLREDERIIFALRELYLEYGYTPYRMSKFEEYDLYAGNKDFLVSDNVITFNDTDGTLLALKPDVTLSIIKNFNDDSTIRKICYNENVYRPDKGTGFFREIMQSGLECFGPITEDDLCEVINLASLSLSELSKSSSLTLSDIDLVRSLVDAAGLSSNINKKIYELISSKNTDGLKAILKEAGCNKEVADALLELLLLNGSVKDVRGIIKEKFASYLPDAKVADDFAATLEKLDAMGLGDKISIDFSVFGDVNYYNGIVFNGFIEGVAEPVLSGGQYDKTMERLGKRSKAVGFAVYLNDAEFFNDEGKASDDSYINIALPKGRLGEDAYKLFEEAGYPCPQILEEGRKLIFENAEKKVRYFWVKPSDVAIYVERAAADIGVCGKDTIEEYEPDIYELLDMNMGKCRMAVAAKKDFVEDDERTLRVASKFSNIARKYYQKKGRDIDIIHLNGSIEIAPVIGLSDVIVDIVETGTTLKENNLEVKEEIMPISARLICNKSSYEFKGEKIRKIVSLLSEKVKER